MGLSHPLAVVLGLSLLLPTLPLDTESEDVAVEAFGALHAVYETAAMLESLRTGGALPELSGTAELSQAVFGSTEPVERLVDPWGTALHVESVPGRGYVVASAGSDRQFDRSSWEAAAETTSSAEDIVVRDGRLVRSPEAWALGLAPLTLERLEGEASRTKHEQTVGNLRALITGLLTYEITVGSLPAVDDLDGLATQLVPSYMPDLPRTDGWGRPLVFAMTMPGSYSLVSVGPDGRHGTSDDIVAENGLITKNEAAPAGDPVASAYADYQMSRRRLESGR